jgi:hypothetical protein
LGLPVGDRVRLHGHGELGFRFFGHEATQRYVSRGAGGNAEAYFGPISVHGGGGVSRTRDRFSLEVDQRLEHTSKQAEAGISAEVTSRLSFGYSHPRLWQSYGAAPGTDPELALQTALSLDRVTDINRVDSHVKLTDATSLVAFAEFQKDRFEHVVSARSEATSTHYAGGFNFSELAFVTGSLLVGVRNYAGGEAEAVPANRTWTVSAQLGMNFLLHSHLGLTASRDLTYSIYETGDATAPPRNSYIVNNYSALLGFSLPKDLILRMGYSFQTAQYQDLGDAPLGNPRTHGLEFSLLRAFGDNLRIGGTVHLERRTANEGFRYESFRYGVAAEWLP